MPSKHTEKNTNNFMHPNWNFFYGSFHGHSSHSIGIAPPNECYNYAYRNNLDYLILADHSSFISSTSDRWSKGLDHAHKFNKKREGFTAFYGFEGKSKDLGDLNIINSNTFFTGNISNLNILPLWMLNNQNAFIILSNPLKNILLFKYNPIINKIISSIEVTSGLASRYLRRDKYYFKLLDLGWKLGAVNGLNDSNLNFGDTENLTCVVSTKNSKENLAEGIRLRRTYSTESKTLKLLFFINNNFMGTTIPLSDELKFTLIVEDRNYSIEKIDIISNEGVIVHSIKNIGLKKMRYLYTHLPKENESWYVIKVYEETDKIAISSPIFIEKNPKA